MSKNVQIVKVITGETLIGETSLKSDSTLLVKNVCVIFDRGQGQLGFAPYVPFSKEDSVTFNLMNVVFMTEPADPLVNEYNRIFSTIALPEEKKLITTA